jgi:hypothetical protein
MRIFIATFALAFVASNSVYAQDLTQQQIEGVQGAIKAENCTVEDTAIKAKDGGYKARGVICGADPIQYAVTLDKDFKITKKKEMKKKD